MVAGLVDDAIGLTTKNRMFEAESRLRQARYLSPGNPRIEFNLAMVLDQIGQSDEAIELLNNLDRRTPNRPDTMIGLATVKVSLGQHAEAMELLKRVFRIFRAAKNDKRASLVARSISNVAFIMGAEQEALCYSYEAFAILPSDDQLGRHAQMLVAQNLFATAKDFVEAVTVLTPGLTKKALVKHSLAMARFALKDYEGALAAENAALDFLAKDPQLGGEINAAWYIMRTKMLTGQESEKELTELANLKQAAIDYRAAGVDALMMMPPELRRMIDEIPEEEQ